MRRLLLAADLLGLVFALLLSEWIVNARSNAGSLDARAEFLVFMVTLPGWVVVAKLYGLYDRDEERTDHSTADDFAGVFHMVTVCTWLFTIGFLHLGFWKAVLAILLWPYYLGVHFGALVR